MIKGSTNISGRNVYYDRRRMNWTVDPAELTLTDAELRSHRERQVAEFDEIFGGAEHDKQSSRRPDPGRANRRRANVSKTQEQVHGG